MFSSWPSIGGRVAVIREGWLAVIGISGIRILCMERRWLVGDVIGAGPEVMIALIKLALEQIPKSAY